MFLITAGGALTFLTHRTESLPKKVKVKRVAFDFDVLGPQRDGAHGVCFVGVFFVAYPHVRVQN